MKFHLILQSQIVKANNNLCHPDIHQDLMKEARKRKHQNKTSLKDQKFL